MIVGFNRTWFFLQENSTTWVFIGLLAGRELAMRSFQKDHDRGIASTFRLIGKDLLFAVIGLAVSIALAAATNPAVFTEIFNR